jgi:hypothetical protein
MESKWYRKVDTVPSATFLNSREMQHLWLFRVILDYVRYRTELNAPLTRKLKLVFVDFLCNHTEVQEHLNFGVVLMSEETMKQHSPQ